MRCRLAVALIGVVTVAGGCSALGVRSPTAAVKGVSLQDIDARGFTLNFAVDLTNPNAVALPLSNADYALQVSGTKLLEGKAAPAASLPANGSTAVALPVRLTYENLLAAEQAIAKGGGQMPYALDGGLSFSTGNPLVGSVRAPLRYNGTVDLRQLLRDPQVLLQSPAARQLAEKALGSLFSR